MSTEIISSRNGLKAVKIANAAASAEIMLLGAHLVSYKTADGTEHLWMSERSFFEEGKPIRGGVPVCWPWFGPNAENSALPAHGMVRQRLWEFVGAEEPDARTTRCTFVIRDTPELRKLWDHAFELSITFTVSDTLTIALTTKNTGDAPFTISQALHTYFRIQDIMKAEVLGLENKAFTNKAGGHTSEEKMGAAPVTFGMEVDRVFHDAPGPFTLLDKAAGKSVHITTEGSNSAVTWNPWIEKSIKMSADFPPEGYKEMVCVETANALSDARIVRPGEAHTLKAHYTFE